MGMDEEKKEVKSINEGMGERQTAFSFEAL